LRKKEVASVKVLWRNQFAEETTWKAEEDMKKRYPYIAESRGNANQGIPSRNVASLLEEKRHGSQRVFG